MLGLYGFGHWVRSGGSNSKKRPLGMKAPGVRCIYGSHRLGNLPTSEHRGARIHFTLRNRRSCTLTSGISRS